MRRVCLLTTAAVAAACSVAAAQGSLTLAAAIDKAHSANPAVLAARAGEHEAEARVRQAQAGWLPRVDFAEGVQRGDLPVYVFGSLLSQRRFAASNFAIDALNHPDPITNHRASVAVQHALFSPDVQTGVHAARVAEALAVVGRDTTDRDLALEVTRAFGRALTAATAYRASQAAVTAAEEDARRTRDRRDAGLVTEGDVLALDVHLAQMTARAIDADAQRRIALAALNRTMGEPLDREYVLETPLPADPSGETLPALEEVAVKTRPEAHRAELQERLAAVQQSGARQSFLPQVGWQGGYEWNGAEFTDRAGGWIVGAEVRLNVFRGFADRARLAEAGSALERAGAERALAESGIRLDVRSAWLRLEAARARVGVGAAALAQARESQRIIRDRYEAGLANVSDVLRAAQALLDAELQQTSARVDVVMESAALDRAVGR
jgi:outer membrane protein